MHSCVTRVMSYLAFEIKDFKVSSLVIYYSYSLYQNTDNRNELNVTKCKNILQGNGLLRVA